MANHGNRPGMSRPQPSQSQQVPGLQDNAPRSRVLIEYDVPDEDGLWGETTTGFGSIRTFGIKLLTPLEEKDAARASSGDTMSLAYELARRSVGQVINERAESITIHEHDGTSMELWAQLHPKLRSLIMQAYSENAAPSNGASARFLASRRIKA